MSDPNEPKRPAPGFAGRASSIGKELGDDFDFEPDALLDSLLFDEAPAVPTPKKIKLHEPVKREFSEDEVTVVGRTEDLFARVQADDGTSGLEDLANSDIDELLSSTPASAPVELPLIPPMPAPPSVVIAPELPAVPRVTSAVPRPGLRVTSGVPRPGSEITAKPPAVNPAGPPSRQPFPPAVSPQAPRAAPRPVEATNKALPSRPGPGPENQAPPHPPPPTAPPHNGPPPPQQ